MSIRSSVVLACLWVLSLFAVGTIVVHAQTYRTNPFPEPKILSGADFGIRIEGEQNGKPVGPLVVKINDKWVEVQVGSANPTRPVR